MPAGGFLSVRGLVKRFGLEAGRMVVLIYHRVHPAVDPMYPNEVTAEIFEWQMKMLRNYLEPLDLEQALRMRDMGELPPGAVAVTFDDGYADNFDVALPILKRTAVPATFFVTTGYLDGGRMWNDTVFESIRRLPPGIVDLDSVGLGRREIAGFESRRQIARETIDSIKHMAPSERQMRADALARTAVTPLPNDLMMTADQVRSIEKSGMRVGAHTLTHPILRAVPGSQCCLHTRTGSRTQTTTRICIARWCGPPAISRRFRRGVVRWAAARTDGNFLDSRPGTERRPDSWPVCCSSIGGSSEHRRQARSGSSASFVGDCTDATG